jgi:hypothetical protein
MSGISVTKWGVRLIKLLLSITHKQWLYRSTNIHLRFDGLTSHQHSLLSDRIHELIRTSPADLLPCHCHLLLHNFFHLVSDSTLKCQLWVASMESAISAASHVSSGHHTPGSLQMFYTLPLQAHPCQSPFSARIPTMHPHQLPLQCPRQQNLPASFWTSHQTIPPIFPPHKAHTTNLTGKEFHLHWQRK